MSADVVTSLSQLTHATNNEDYLKYQDISDLLLLSMTTFVWLNCKQSRCLSLTVPLTLFVQSVMCNA